MITEEEKSFMIENVFLNQESETVDLKDVDLKYLWRTMEVAVKGSLHPEPGIAFLAERLRTNIEDSIITVGVCFLDKEKLVD